MRALRRHTPSLGGQHVVLVLASGLTLPPLTFSAGGVKAFFAALKQVRSATARGAGVPVLAGCPGRQAVLDALSLELCQKLPCPVHPGMPLSLVNRSCRV